MAKQITIRGLILNHIPKMFVNRHLHTEVQDTALDTLKTHRSKLGRVDHSRYVTLIVDRAMVANWNSRR